MNTTEIKAPQGLSADVELVARQCLLDWLGVAVAGSREPVAIAARRSAAMWAGRPAGPATVTGTSARLGAHDAAFCNGVAGHALDYDDTVTGPFHGHATSPMLAAILALGEQVDATVAAVLAALVRGIAAASAVGREANPAHYEAGWHSTATIGAIGAAAGCALLLGLDEHQRDTAIALAAVHAAGLKASFGTMAKPLQVGRANANGLTAAVLAANGADVPPELLDGPGGFLEMHAAVRGDWPEDGSPILATRFKQHAACHSSHSAINAVARLRREHHLAPGDVSAIDIRVAPTILSVCNIATPTSGLAAKFSLRWVSAMALRGDDTTDPATFADGRALDPELAAIAGRVSVGADDSLTEWQARATLTLAGGGILEALADTDAEGSDVHRRAALLDRKFGLLATPVLGESAAAGLHEAVAGAGAIGVRDLMRMTAGAAE